MRPRLPPHLAPRLPNSFRSRGFAAASALFTIALFVLIGAVGSSAARSNAKAKMFHEIKEQLIAQSDLIFNTLLLCRTVYPSADNGTDFHISYPATGDGKVASMICPGQPDMSIWSGDARAMAPRTLPGFSEWNYINDATSVRISIEALNPNVPYYRDLLDAVVSKVGPTKAVRSNDTMTITLAN